MQMKREIAETSFLQGFFNVIVSSNLVVASMIKASET